MDNEQMIDFGFEFDPSDYIIEEEEAPAKLLPLFTKKGKEGSTELTSFPEGETNANDAVSRQTRQEPKKQEQVQRKPLPKTTIKTKDIPFDPSDYEYDLEPEEHPYALQYAPYTKREYESLSPEKKKELQEYSPLKGLAKGVLKGATLGESDKEDSMAFGLAGYALGTGKYTKLDEDGHEAWSGAGEFIGAALPISLLSKAISWPLKAIGGLMKFGGAATTVAEIGGSAVTGAAYSASKQAIAGEEISGEEAAWEAATFAGSHTGILGIFKGIPMGMQWINSLKVSQRANVLVDGVIPKDLNPNSYDFYAKEIVPELQKSAKNKWAEAYKAAAEKSDAEFAQKMEAVKQEHETKLRERAQKQDFNEQDFEKAKQEYQNKLKQVAAEHEAEVAKIEQENQVAQEQFQKDQKEFQKLQTRQQIVKDAIEPKESALDLQGRVKQQGEDTGFRPAPGVLKDPSLRNKVGSIFSDNVVKNESKAGLENVQAIRANDTVDYQEVKNAYDKCRQLNAQVTVIQPNLSQDLIQTRKNLKLVPKLSPPQEQMLTVVDALLNDIVILGENGSIIGFKPINNNILEEQAKALRYFMDFNFEHGNTRGIFTPLVKQIEDAIELGANFVGHAEAAQANKTARSMYAQWAKDYDNDYIRPFRDTNNQDYIKLFNKTLDPDTYPVIDNILSRSNVGQQLSAGNKRALIENELKPFFENRGKVHSEKFEDAMKRLRGVITPEQERSIVEVFAQERRAPVIKGKKVEAKEFEKAPKTKELPRGKVPLFKEKLKIEKPIKEPKMPVKEEIKPSDAMKAAGKIMKMTPEEAMSLSKTPTGMKKLKEHLPERLFEKLGKDRLKQILYKGKVKHEFTGNELDEIFNDGDNYAMFSEILGEETAAELHVNAKEIGDKAVTVKNLKKAGVHMLKLKALLSFGIL